MAARRILLRVKEEIGCPLFRAGDQMVIDLPGVDRTASANVCALTVAKVVAELGLGPCEGAALPALPPQVLCPRSERPVLFDVQRLEDSDSAAPLMMGSITGDLGQAVAALRSVPIFRPLPAGVLASLVEKIRIEQYEPRQTVVEKGTMGRAFYIVYQGDLEVVGYADQEVASVVSRLRARDCFGEMSLLTGAPCAATVVAASDVTLLTIPKEDFERLLRENTYMASCFTRLLASRLMATNILLVKEGSKPFSGKLQEMPLPTVLQVLADSNRSGTLIIDDYCGKQARVAFSQGRIFEAHVGDLSGEAAIFALLRWTKGDFWLDKRMVPTEDKVDCSVMGLLLEGMRRQDEGSRDPDAPPVPDLAG